MFLRRKLRRWRFKLWEVAVPWLEPKLSSLKSCAPKPLWWNTCPKGRDIRPTWQTLTLSRLWFRGHILYKGFLNPQRGIDAAFPSLPSHLVHTTKNTWWSCLLLLHVCFAFWTLTSLRTETLSFFIFPAPITGPTPWSIIFKYHWGCIEFLWMPCEPVKQL